MRKSVKVPFDPQNFLAKVCDGKTILNYRRIRLFFHRDRSRMEFLYPERQYQADRRF